MITGLFLVRRLRICITRWISSSRPITGSSLPWRAASVRSTLYFSSAWYLRLRRRAVDARAAADLLQRAVDALLVDAALAQDARRLALALVGDRDQQVLDADELVLEALGLGVRRLEHAHDARRRVDLHDVVASFGACASAFGDARRAAAPTSTFELLEDAAAMPLVVRAAAPGGRARRPTASGAACAPSPGWPPAPPAPAL